MKPNNKKDTGNGMELTETYSIYGYFVSFHDGIQEIS